jgi:hypothetical protein
MDDHDPRNHDRALERYGIAGDVDVYDSLRDVYLGRLVNIHTQGLMLLGDVALDEDKLYKLDLNLPAPINGRTSIPMGVDCLWTRNADYNGKHWAGFAIIDLSPQAADDIRMLVQQLGQG